ncbi:MAG TPA: hypothetical protein VEH55_08575 [Gaiellaceae bacterium]|jgi:hypothetical protein|nr:hypothetical protein [Gaiellaceae bacterium]
MSASPESAQRAVRQPTLVAAPAVSKRKLSDILLVTLFVAVEVAWVGGLATLAAWLIFS